MLDYEKTVHSMPLFLKVHQFWTCVLFDNSNVFSWSSFFYIYIIFQQLSFFRFIKRFNKKYLGEGA
jgi:hypothetical protein